MPADARIHPVTHVSQLKKHVGNADKVVSTLPPMDPQEKQRAVGQWLIHWAHSPLEEATWEFADERMLKFPNLRHEVMAS